MKTIYTNVDVEVDIDLDDFSDDELIEELEQRGYKTLKYETPLERADIEKIINILGDPRIGSEEYFLLEKMRFLYCN